MNRLKKDIYIKLKAIAPSCYMHSYTERQLLEVTNNASRLILKNTAGSQIINPAYLPEYKLTKRAEENILRSASIAAITSDLRTAKRELLHLISIRKSLGHVSFHVLNSIKARASKLVQKPLKDYLEAINVLIDSQRKYCRSLIKSAASLRTASINT